MRASSRARLPSRGGMPMKFPLIERLEDGHVFKRAEAEAAMEELLTGRVETPEIVRLLAALNQRPAEVQEIAGIVRALRPHAHPVVPGDWERIAVRPRRAPRHAACGSGE